MSEEKQGEHIVEAARKVGIQVFLWSTLPSSREISGGKFVTRFTKVSISCGCPLCCDWKDPLMGTFQASILWTV